MKLKHLVLAVAAASCILPAYAGNSIDLSRYSVTGTYALDTLGGMGLEASAVTFARDRGTLFFVGDEGMGVVEISKTGQTLGSMTFDWTGTNSTHNDSEGLTYLGNGQLVVVDERPQIAYSFSFSNGGNVMLNNQPKVAITGSTTSVKNVGTEGISYDPRDGSFVSVKQDNPAQLRAGSLTFAAGGGTTGMGTLFSGTSSLFGLNSLSDVQTLSPVDALAGTPAADNLLILSLDSRKLVEIKRDGTVLSSLDLSNVLPNNGIEGVTIDNKGTIYLVAEQIQDGSVLNPQSQLIVLTAPVPEPETYAMLLAGLGLMAGVARRRQQK